MNKLLNHLPVVSTDVGRSKAQSTTNTCCNAEDLRLLQCTCWLLPSSGEDTNQGDKKVTWKKLRRKKKNFFYFSFFRKILAGGRCPPDPPGFGWGGKAPPDSPPKRSFVTFDRGGQAGPPRSNDFFSAPLTTRAPPGRPPGRPAERPAGRVDKICFLGPLTTRVPPGRPARPNARPDAR